MTEKRFTLIYINEQHISANLYDNGTFIGSIKLGERLIAELLNSLNNENEQLKQGMDKLFNYFAKWFEEERGIYIEEFIELWENIQKEELE